MTSSEVPVEEVRVALWDESQSRQEDNEDAIAWIVKSSAEDHKKYRIWTKSEFPEHVRKDHPHILEDVDIGDFRRKGGFVNGRALRDISFPINTAGGAARPQELFRAVHKGTPNKGIQARGHGLVTACALFFQMQVQRHLNWQCRDPSPFMSVTSSWEKVCDVCAMYEAREFEDIQILVITLNGPDWNHKKSRLWHLETLLGRLPLLNERRKPYHRHEYLVQDSIPSSSVTRTKWDTIKHKHIRIRRIRAKEYEAIQARKSSESKQQGKDIRAEKKRKAETDQTSPDLDGSRSVKKRCKDFGPSIKLTRGE